VVLGAHGEEPEVGAPGVPRVDLIGASDQIVQGAPIAPEQAKEEAQAEEEEAEREDERP
jgi:hypothetical protein